MKTISVAVSEGDYDAFRRKAEQEHRPIAQLIREAMARYRAEEIEPRKPLREVPVLLGHAAAAPLPEREELYDEIFEDRT